MNALGLAAALSEGIVLVEHTDRAPIRVRGKDRVTWLNGLLTCDVALLAPGKAGYGLLLEKKGKIRADFFVLVGADEIVLAGDRARAEELVAALDHYLIMEDVELEVTEGRVLSAHGPRAEAAFAAARVGGALSLLGVPGAVAIADEDAEALAASSGGVVIEGDTWAALAIEAGLPRLGAEVDDTLYPQEAALAALAVSFEKGCYLGQEVVYMLEHRGHEKRRLAPVALEGDTLPAIGAEVLSADGAPVGDVRSAARGPVSGALRAIAMLKRAHAAEGTRLSIGGAGAVVVPRGIRASDRA